MPTVQATAVGWIDGAFPCWVEVVLTDAAGHTWRLFDKASVFDDRDRLTAHTQYPLPVELECEIIRAEPSGVVLVALHQGIEAEDGTTTFRIALSRLRG